MAGCELVASWGARSGANSQAEAPLCTCCPKAQVDISITLSSTAGRSMRKGNNGASSMEGSIAIRVGIVELNRRPIALLDSRSRLDESHSVRRVASATHSYHT